MKKNPLYIKEFNVLYDVKQVEQSKKEDKVAKRWHMPSLTPSEKW